MADAFFIASLVPNVIFVRGFIHGSRNVIFVRLWSWGRAPYPRPESKAIVGNVLVSWQESGLVNRKSRDISGLQARFRILVNC
jgi:hypothetical protein